MMYLGHSVNVDIVRVAHGTCKELAGHLRVLNAAAGVGGGEPNRCIQVKLREGVQMPKSWFVWSTAEGIFSNNVTCRPRHI